MKDFIKAVKKLAFEMPAPNPYTPRLVMMCIAANEREIVLNRIIKSLISDIESMQERPQTFPEQFGPFSEYEMQGDPYLEDKVVIEWPNLAISLEALQAELAKVQSND